MSESETATPRTYNCWVHSCLYGKPRYLLECVTKCPTCGFALHELLPENESESNDYLDQIFATDLTAGEVIETISARYGLPAAIHFAEFLKAVVDSKTA